MLSKLGWRRVHAIYSATPSSAVGPTPPMAAILHTCEATCESVFARISLASLSLFIKRTCKPRPLFSLSSLSLSLSEIASASDSNRRILHKLWVETIFIPISCFDFAPYLGVFNCGGLLLNTRVKVSSFSYIIAKWRLFLEKNGLMGSFWCWVEEILTWWWWVFVFTEFGWMGLVNFVGILRILSS